MYVWDRRPEEPAEWYELFIAWCLLGPRRSLAALWRAHCRENPAEKRRRPPEAWALRREQHEWVRRAQAWDDAEQESRSPDEHRVRLGRRRRSEIARHAVERALHIIDVALDEELDAHEARILLPVARQLLRDMLLVERAEESDVRDRMTRKPDGGLTAEELLAADAPHTRPHTLLVVTGADPALAIDVSTLRAVDADRFAIRHLDRATRDDLLATLRREQARGEPIHYVHLACHASHAGVEFADGLADGAWLSRALLGVRVLLIAGCNSDRVGDWLRAVPWVVTLADAIENDEAATLALHFWGAIAAGRTPDAALDEALARCSRVLREYVVRHWPQDGEAHGPV